MLSRAGAALIVGGMLAAAACIRTGPDPANEARQVVRGDVGELTLGSGRTFRGELLAVTASAFIVFANQRVTVAPRSMVSRITFGVSEFATPDGAIADGDLATLRGRSRFPFGLTSAAMASLLSTTGQSSPDTVGNAPR